MWDINLFSGFDVRLLQTEFVYFHKGIHFESGWILILDIDLPVQVPVTCLSIFRNCTSSRVGSVSIITGHSLKYSRELLHLLLDVDKI